MNKELFLIDGMALIYRAYFGLLRNPRITSGGEDVSAVFGFANTLLDLQKTYTPTHLAVALDTPGPTFRHEIFPEYKATRDTTPDGIRSAIPRIKALIRAFGILTLEYPGFEADDVIGTLARIAQKADYNTCIVTPDKDYAQLVDEHTLMLKPTRSGGAPRMLDVSAILEQWNVVRVQQVTDVLGLAGDPADNIPGVPGIGLKTAQKLVARYGSVENILANTSNLKGKLKESLETRRKDALLSKQLVTIKCDVPIKESPDDLIPGKRDDERLKQLFAELEFKTLSRRLFGDVSEASSKEQSDMFEATAAPPPPVDPPLFKSIDNVKHNYHLVSTSSERMALARKLEASNSSCFDLETSGLDVRNAALVGIAFSMEPHEAWYVPLPPDPEQTRLVLEPFLPWWANPSIKKIGQNLKFDISVLLWHNIEVKGELIDTMIAHHLIHPDQNHNMEYLAKTLLSYHPIPITSLIGKKGTPQKSMREVELGRLCEYAAEDADVTLQIWKRLEPILKEHGQERVFYKIEMPLLPVLARMEHYGINLDTAALKHYSAVLEAAIKQLNQSICTQAGMPFNINSPKQLGEVLFERLHLVENPKKTKKGQYKTNEEVLTELAPFHPIIRSILNFRQLTKLKTTYVEALPKEVCKKSGRVHTTFSQAVTATGRLSSINPNLQNIPIRTEEGRQIRRAFIPRAGCKILSCDYSQIELRIMADLSGDSGLQRAFQSGADIHTATAARVFGVKPSDVTREMRGKAKIVNYGIIYGISAFGLSRRLGIPRGAAADIINQYRASYPDVQNYLDITIDFARKHEYVETITGRRRYIRNINTNNRMVRSGAERNAINAPIQGTAADMIKIAMVSIDRLLAEKKAETRLLLQVHDELVFDLAPSEQGQLVPLIEEKMRTALPMKTPILVGSGIGVNWLEAH